MTAFTQSPKGTWRYSVKVFGRDKRGNVAQWHYSGHLGESVLLGRERAVTLAREWLTQNMSVWTFAYASASYWRIDDSGKESLSLFRPEDNIQIQIDKETANANAPLS